MLRPMTLETAIDGARKRPVLEVDGNRLMLIPGGPERFAALGGLIEGARKRLDLYFYIFSPDRCGLELLDLMIDACNRGVTVTLLVDAFGSANMSDARFEPLIEAGGRFARFGHRRSTRYLIRNHQKMVIVDGKAAMIGGFNLGDAYFAPDDDPDGWCDMGLRMDGPLAKTLEGWFDQLAEWTLGKQSFLAMRRMIRDWRPGVGRAVLLMGGPTRHLNGWARHVKHDIQAGHRLDMVAAYFSPGWGMIRRIGRLSRAGAARIVTAGKSDNMATIGAARHIYRRLLRAGVAILEYQPQKLHAKLIAIDDIAYVGSANFDMRSLFVNVEIMLRVEDAAFAQAVRDEMDIMSRRSRAIDRATYRAMAGPISQLRWWCDYFLVGVLDYTVTRRLTMRRKSRAD
jgi:cardiolipin synthase